MTNSKVKGFLIERDGRSLFMKEVEPWAIEDVNYKVTPLVSGLMEDREEPLVEAPSLQNTDAAAERIQLMNEIFELEEKEIALLKERLEEAVELVESIHEFASKQTNNIMESRGLLLLIASACDRWLKPKE